MSFSVVWRSWQADYDLPPHKSRSRLGNAGFMEDFGAGLWLTCQIDSRTLFLTPILWQFRTVWREYLRLTHAAFCAGTLRFRDPSSIQAILEILPIQTLGSLSVLLAGAYPAESSQFGGFAINCIVFRTRAHAQWMSFFRKDSLLRHSQRFSHFSLLCREI